MKHVRMQFGVTIALAAVLVLALAVSNAAALPEFGQCFVQPKHEGKYTNSVCTAKAKTIEVEGKKVPTGEFEWRKATEMEAAKRKVTGSGGELQLTAYYRACEPSFAVRAQKCHEGETEGTIPFPVHCTSETNAGEISSNNALKNIKVTLTGCTDASFNTNCHSGATAEVITLNTLKGKLGFINKSSVPRQVGVVLEPATAKGKFTTYTCDGPELSFTIGMGNETEGCAYPLTKCGGDGVIAALTPVNTATSAFTQVLTENEELAEDIPSKFIGTAPLKEFEGYTFRKETTVTSMWSKVGAALTNSDNTPEAIEIKAN